MDKLELIIAKHVVETDLRKRAVAIRDEADLMLDEMAKDHAAKHNGDYLDSYGAVSKTELGHRILTHREDCSRFIESQVAQD